MAKFGKPSKSQEPRLVVIDIDGLRRDVFLEALGQKALPVLGKICGGEEARQGVHIPALTIVPGITFSCQASIFTGAYAAEHGLIGNQFFNRFGHRGDGRPRHYAFDIGDSLAYDDAVRVFSGGPGLANECLAPEIPTLYEIAKAHGASSLVSYNMIARGADHWVRPSVLELARFKKGGSVFGLGPAAYDRRMVNRTLAALKKFGCPDVLSVYFMGLDFASHMHGPGRQLTFLREHIDAEIGRLILGLPKDRPILFCVVSDHGQIPVMDDTKHAIQLGVMARGKLGRVFRKLGRKLNNAFTSDLSCDTVFSSNGVLAQVYVRSKGQTWDQPAAFNEEVLPLALGLRNAEMLEADMRHNLGPILVRDVAGEGWEAQFKVISPEGRLWELNEYFPSRAESGWFEPGRVNQLAGRLAGDIVIFCNSQEGYYLGPRIAGMHGGLLREESECVLSMALSENASDQVPRLRDTVAKVVLNRGQREGRSWAGIVDMVPILKEFLHWT